jgi:hypothetical protein
MVSATNHDRLMRALDSVSLDSKLPSRISLAATAGVSTSTMNRDPIFLDAYSARATAWNTKNLEAPPPEDDGNLARARDRARTEAAQQKQMVETLAAVVQELSLENARLRRELHRRDNLRPV